MLVTLAFNVLCTTQRTTKLVKLYLLFDCYHISFFLYKYICKLFEILRVWP